MKFCNDFFTHEDFSKLHNILKSIYENPNSTYRTNYTGWQEQLVEGSSVVLMIDFLPGDPVRDIVIPRFREVFGENQPDEKIGLSAYYWTSGSCIDWHNDRTKDDKPRRAATIYMNMDWDTDYNGFLVYHDENDFCHAVPPTPNSAVYFEENPLHSVAKTTKDAPVRMTFQMFINL